MLVASAAALAKDDRRDRVACHPRLKNKISRDAKPAHQIITTSGDKFKDKRGPDYPSELSSR